MNMPDLPPNLAAAIDALGVCRRAMITVLRTVKPMGPTYKGAGLVIDAIDAFAKILTGDAQFFWTGGSVEPGRAEVVRARQREVDEG